MASVGLWAGWAVVLGAGLVPSAVTLTVVRTIAPGALVVALLAALDGHASPLGIATAAVALMAVMLAETGRLFVNGASYPNERRFPLRPSAPLLVGVLPLAWVLCVGSPIAGALLLATRHWVIGGLVAAAAGPLVYVLSRSLHGLSRRWIVFVPAGLVLHDPSTLADPVLFRRQTVTSFGPAPRDSAGLDLTQRAPGLALELALREALPVVCVTPGDRNGRPESPDRLLFTPTRPGAVLAEAARRHFPAHGGSAPVSPREAEPN